MKYILEENEIREAVILYMAEKNITKIRNKRHTNKYKREPEYRINRAYKNYSNLLI